MHKKTLTKMFKMEDYVIDHIEYFDDLIEIECHVRARRMICTNESSIKVVETKIRRIDHMMLEDKPVILLVTQRRFQFKNGKRLWEPLPNVKGKQRATNEFKKNTLRELQRDNYSATGFKRHKSGMYTSKLLDSLEFEVMWPKSLTKLGLDGKYVRGHQLIHNVTNISDRKVATVLPDLSQEELKKFSNQSDSRTKITN